MNNFKRLNNHHRWVRVHGPFNQVYVCTACGARSIELPGDVHVRWVGSDFVARHMNPVGVFQAAYGLMVDDVLGPQTADAITRFRIPDTCAETVVIEMHND